jgi:hypothetical protein
MTGDGDLSSLETSLGDMFRRLGLPDPAAMSRLMADWDDLAGDPWRGRSKPVVIQDQTLVIEASTASAVAYLRYGESDLLARLAEAFGSDSIKRIEVRPPPRR